METVLRYFPSLTDQEQEKLHRLAELYLHWNQKINLISRKDMDHLYVRHILHSMSIAKFVNFAAGSRIMDAGTGGGLPGLPLAILFPEVEFTLVDSIGKKIRVVKSISSDIGLSNVIPLNNRIEHVHNAYDFVLSRAVTAFPRFIHWVRDKIVQGSQSSLPNGIFYLKGGELEEEIRPWKNRISVFHLEEVFREPYFETKKLVYLSCPF